MTRVNSTSTVSRRTFAAGTLATSLVAGLATHHAVAQDAASTTSHPIVGTWLAMVTINEGEARPALLVYGADGSVFVGMGLSVVYDHVLADIQARDARDSGRGIAPLRKAEDAMLLDTSTMGVAEAVASAIELVEQVKG